MWTEQSTAKKAYDPHPAGPYVARICDIWESDMDNKYFGQLNAKGEKDERRTIRKVCIGFLTAEHIEVNGEMKPRYTSFWAAASWHEKSNLRKFIGGFAPDIAAQKTVDPEQLIGRILLVNVEQYRKMDGTIGHGVKSAMPVPKGMENLAPSLEGYIRHNDKQPQ